MRWGPDLIRPVSLQEETRTQRKGHVETWREEQSGHLQAEERASPETSSASTLSLDFQHPEPWRKISLLFKFA